MSVLYEFPEQAAYGKILPKTKIYSYARTTTRLKELFVKEVERIIWSYKLSSDTVNLPASGFVQEIQVITVELKRDSLSEDILEAIDRAVPSPIIFILKTKHKLKYMAAYKRQHEGDKAKWVVSSYFESDWIKADKNPKKLPISMNLKVLYQALLKNLITIKQLANESFEKFIERVEELNAKKKEADKLEIRMKREKQYNRKVDLHTKLGNLKKEIKALTT